MNDQSPIIVDDVDEVIDDTPFDHSIACYMDLYLRHCMSQSPRTEIAFAFILFTVVAGFLCSVLPRIYKLSPEAAWLAVTFLGSLGYHLRDSLYCQAMVVDEALFRLFNHFGRHIGAFVEEPTRVRDLSRFGLCSLAVCAVLVVSAYSIILAFDALDPTVILRKVHFTGGG